MNKIKNSPSKTASELKKQKKKTRAGNGRTGNHLTKIGTLTHSFINEEDGGGEEEVVSKTSLINGWKP